MKVLLLTLSMLIALPLVRESSFDEVIRAIKSGHADEIARYFDNSVEITLPEKSNSYSKSQAEMVMREFFIRNAVKDFDVIHQSEKSASQYCIGNLSTGGGVYRTTIYMKQKGNKQVIQELRFEK